MTGADLWWRGALALAVWLGAGGVAVAGPLDDFAVEEVAPGNFVHYGSLEARGPGNAGDQANIGFIVGERCVAVVDTGGTRAVGEALLAAVRRVTAKPVCHVILTHVHPDHVFGAAALRGPGTRFVAHGGHPRAMALVARPYLTSLRRDLGDLADGTEVVPPDLLVKDSVTLDLGGRSIRVEAWPVSHTTNDLTVLDEATGTLWLGDLLFVDHTPVVDGSILGFLKVMEELSHRPVARCVPGHGRPAAGWPTVLDAQRDYLEGVVRGTRAALKARRTLEEAVEGVGREAAAAGWRQFDLFHPRNVSAAYTELEWE